MTRDRQYGICEWNGRTFHIIDTGGLVYHSQTFFEKAIVQQVNFAISESDGIIFMVDAIIGLTALDEDIAQMLIASQKRLYVVVNKVDNHQRLLDASEFYSLGIENVFYIAASNGSGTGDLLDAIIHNHPSKNTTDEDNNKPPLPKFAIVGQPNVGKSSFLNALTNQERSIVSPISGTTRDAISTTYNLFKKQFILVDTAGIRKKNKEKEDVEFYAIIRAIKAIDESDIVFLLIDATKGITQQDLHLFDLITKKGKGILLLVNKWDMIVKDTQSAKVFENNIFSRIAPFTDIPIIFISAIEKTRIFKAIDLALTVFERRQQQIKTSVLNNFLQEATTQHQTPSYRGHFVKIKYITQLPTKVPSFALFCNFPEGVKQNYKHYLENQLRKAFSFQGVPIRLFLENHNHECETWLLSLSKN